MRARVEKVDVLGWNNYKLTYKNVCGNSFNYICHNEDSDFERYKRKNKNKLNNVNKIYLVWILVYECIHPKHQIVPIVSVQSKQLYLPLCLWVWLKQSSKQ